MPDNENNNNTTEARDIEKSAVISGDGNAISQSIVHVHSELKAVLVFLFLAIVIAVVATPHFLNKFGKPKFIIANRILRSDAVLIIKAGNEAANRKQPLTVEFDGLPFDEKGIPVENRTDNNRQCWHFSLKDQLPLEKLKDGEHQIRAGFSDGDLIDVQKIIFHTKAPVTAIQITDANGTPNAKEIIVKAASELQIPENTLLLEMFFFDEGEENRTLELKAEPTRDPKTGILCYEYKTKIQGFQKISDKDPRYAEPFFGLKITDQAGNSYYQEQSYAQYMAPGNNRFGFNNFENITVEKLPDGDKKEFINLVVRHTPQPKQIDQLSDGVPPIQLKVTARTDNSRYLEWKSRVKDVKGLTLIYRNKEKIGISKTDSFVDTEKLDKDSADYRVEQEGKDGTRYLSNTESFRKVKYNLRSKPMTVSEGDAEKVFKLKEDKERYSFSVWIPLEYIQNDFKDNGDGTITDQATGLMWQKSGSPDQIYLKNVPAYIEKLNSERFAGYSDWRLPTVDELKSLLTPKEMNGDLYINPIFDKTQRWCWTSDKRASGGAWLVHFFMGT